MKKFFLVILIIVTFYSINSIGKYSGILEYTFLSVNIIVINNTNNSPTYKAKSNYFNSKYNKHQKSINPSYNLDINSDVFIDTNTNIQIHVHQ